MMDLISQEIFTLHGMLIASIFIMSWGIGLLMTLSHMTPWVPRRRAEFLAPEVEYRASPVKEFTKLLERDINAPKRYTPSTCYLSVIIPAMNEAERIGVMLDDCCDYLEARAEKDEKFTYEIIVVDDGSTDNTPDVVKQISLTRKNLRCMKLKANRGKGGAVRIGVHNCGGKLILFADADGATKFEDFELLEKEMLRAAGGEPLDESFPAVVVGSRAHLAEASVAERSFFRTILMHGFHTLVYLFAVRTIRDTQCGFKLFTRSIAARVFPVLHIERWAFDVELIFLCEKWSVPVSEVCVRWKEIDGSKITPFWSWLQMGRDLILIWFRYTIGLWTDEPPK
ncbi:hypothetical protein GCK72_020162 [Caenorhabditis remanei]|uniref:dolichyl-phosphate beta-glucosyltransferase n=1 Tax=Caenorhabditis remanei TaxID=31234 RepID=A0A6A5GG31_CAERE|nr:hypothetical protein GCK72_020162 [Caenorhabditis remanei]KAF1753605.1 hypothetical protein GCK72_020162 [Caenorhabditis remanei]